MTDVVLSCGPNPALDVTYRLPHWSRGQSHRVPEVQVRAGGKATNVARIVHALGGTAELIAPLGGATGELFAQEMRGSGVTMDVVPWPGETRRSVAVVDDAGEATVFNEAGTPVDDAAVASLLDRVRRRLRAGDVGVLTLNGSLPPGMPATALEQALRAAREEGVPTLLDTSAHLVDALAWAPDLVKPNREELLDAVGTDGVQGVDALWTHSPGTIVVASAGPDGLLCALPARDDVGAPALRRWCEAAPSWWRVRAPQVQAANPTGAGDALVGALCTSLLGGDDLDAALRLAVGTSAAAVQHPLAGAVDPQLARQLAAQVTLERLPTPVPL